MGWTCQIARKTIKIISYGSLISYGKPLVISYGSQKNLWENVGKIVLSKFKFFDFGKVRHCVIWLQIRHTLAKYSITLNHQNFEFLGLN